MKKKISFSTAAVILISILTVAAVLSGVFAKYVKTQEIAKAYVSFSADLADDFSLIEHEAVKNADGSYILNSDNKINENSYLVMPGVDIPKDPQVIISNKSSVDAYLYIETAGICPMGIEYSLTEQWIELPSVTGKNGGSIYVYSEDGRTPAVLDESFTKQSVQVIQDNIVYVSDSIDNPDDFSLKFYAYMAQISSDGAGNGLLSAAESFKNSFETTV